MPGAIARSSLRHALALALALIAAAALAQEATPSPSPSSSPSPPAEAGDDSTSSPSPPAEAGGEGRGEGARAGEGRGEGGAGELAGFTFRGRLEWITAAGGSVPRDTAVNPRNTVLRLPDLAAESELRPDVRVEYGSELALVARPRLLLEYQQARAAGKWQPETKDASARWLELYGSWRIDERLSIAYGLQNYQWGPAELLSPSNRIFHESGFLRDPLFVVFGKHLARVNLSFGQAWTAVILAEVKPNDDPSAFLAGEPFEPKAEAKVEWAPPGGRGYLGLTGGAGQRSRGFFGEYGSLSIGEGFSMYADAVHQVGSRAWVPVDAGPAGAVFAKAEDDGRLRTLALGGIRYIFAGGTDVRLEYLLDEAGWSEAQLALAGRAARAAPGGAPSPSAVAIWLDPGFEMLGRQHAYASVRFPDLPPSKRTTLQLRYLAALEDRSGAGFATASVNASDSVVAFASVTVTHGGDDGALSRLARATAVAGAVVSW